MERKREDRKNEIQPAKVSLVITGEHSACFVKKKKPWRKYCQARAPLKVISPLITLHKAWLSSVFKTHPKHQSVQKKKKQINSLTGILEADIV